MQLLEYNLTHALRLGWQSRRKVFRCVSNATVAPQASLLAPQLRTVLNFSASKFHQTLVESLCSAAPIPQIAIAASRAEVVGSGCVL